MPHALARPRSSGRSRSCSLAVSSVQPLQGSDRLIEASRLAHDLPMHWTLIGQGQDEARIRPLLTRAPWPRLDWVPGGDRRGDPESGLSDHPCWRLITADTPALRERVGGARPDLALVPPGAAAALLMGGPRRAGGGPAPCRPERATASRGDRPGLSRADRADPRSPPGPWGRLRLMVLNSRPRPMAARVAPRSRRPGRGASLRRRVSPHPVSLLITARVTARPGPRAGCPPPCHLTGGTRCWAEAPARPPARARPAAQRAADFTRIR